MKIGFDISQIAHPGGVANYTENLTKELSKFTDLELVFFYSSLRKKYDGNLKNVKSYKLPPSFFEILFNRFRNIPIEKFIGEIDIFHSSDWVQPPTKAKKVTTYHDVIPLKFPEWSHPKIVQVQKRRLKIVEQEIDLVIAVSNATKKDLVEVSSIPDEKIKVIYEGVGENFRVKDEKSKNKFRQKYSLPEKFVLAISGIGERRNLNRLKDVCKDYNLVIAGETIPWVSQDELVDLYNCAACLAYPSLYEGFGLPVIEAFACGLPVITSNVSSMLEVGGDAALYVDPLNTRDIKEKIDLISKDSELRKDLVKKGLVQSKKFSWQNCAKQTVEVYKQLI